MHIHACNVTTKINGNDKYCLMKIMTYCHMIIMLFEIVKSILMNKSVIQELGVGIYNCHRILIWNVKAMSQNRQRLVDNY